MDGEPQGSNISQGKPGNKVSLYTINEVQKTFSNEKASVSYDNSGGSGQTSGDGYEDWRKRLSPIIDTSFPVRELHILRELTNEVYSMNRKIQENVSLEIFDKINNGVPTNNHIVDFTERIRLDGKEYFLVSNSIIFNSRQLVQRIQLVRWE